MSLSAENCRFLRHPCSAEGAQAQGRQVAFRAPSPMTVCPMTRPPAHRLVTLSKAALYRQAASVAPGLFAA